MIRKIACIRDYGITLMVLSGFIIAVMELCNPYVLAESQGLPSGPGMASSLQAFCVPGIPMKLDKDKNGTISFEEASVVPWMSQALFKRLDKNGDMALTPGELPVSPAPNASLIWAEIDANDDGNISAEEANVLPWVTPELFKFMDKNKDGFLSAKEITSTPDMAQMGRRMNGKEAQGNRGPKADTEAATQDRPAGGPPNRPEMGPQDRPDGTPQGRSSEKREPRKTATAEELAAYRQAEKMLTALIMPRIPALVDTNEDGQISPIEAAALPWLTNEIFTKLDKNKDGVLAKDELPAGPPRAGVAFLTMEADQNDDGKISLGEAVNRAPWMTESLFKYLDKDSNGFITESELPPTPPAMPNMEGNGPENQSDRGGQGPQNGPGGNRMGPPPGGHPGPPPSQQF